MPLLYVTGLTSSHYQLCVLGILCIALPSDTYLDLQSILTLQQTQYLPDMSHVLSPRVAENDHVIHVWSCILPTTIKHSRHETLEDGRGIFDAKRHPCKLVSSLVAHKCRLLYVRFLHGNLIVTFTKVELGHYLAFPAASSTSDTVGMYKGMGQ